MTHAEFKRTLFRHAKMVHLNSIQFTARLLEIQLLLFHLACETYECIKNRRPVISSLSLTALINCRNQQFVFQFINLDLFLSFSVFFLSLSALILSFSFFYIFNVSPLFCFVIFIILVNIFEIEQLYTKRNAMLSGKYVKRRLLLGDAFFGRLRSHTVANHVKMLTAPAYSASVYQFN